MQHCLPQGALEALTDVTKLSLSALSLSPSLLSANLPTTTPARILGRAQPPEPPGQALLGLKGAGVAESSFC